MRMSFFPNSSFVFEHLKKLILDLFLTPMCQLLNHPHLSAHIDESDEDALSYMTDLEVRSFHGYSLNPTCCISLRGQNPDCFLVSASDRVLQEQQAGLQDPVPLQTKPIFSEQHHNEGAAPRDGR